MMNVDSSPATLDRSGSDLEVHSLFSHDTEKEQQRILQLATTLSPDLLRGVTLAEATSGFGRHWKSIAVGSDDVELSAPVAELDAFISHDWATPRWQKYLALSHLYNGELACMCSLAVAFACSLLQLAVLAVFGLDSTAAAAMSFSVGPRKERYGWSAQVAAAFVWLLLFNWWQPIRMWLGFRPKQVFLDKLCIHQTDPERKAEGIYGLAGFLRASGTMVVLWSPRYFTRLWCAYELAAWCALKGRRGGRQGIVMYPLSLSIKILTWFLLMFMLLLFGNVILTPVPFVIVYVGLGGLGAAVRASRKINLELTGLHKYLDSFSVQRTNCYCCSSNHIDPQTGFPLICDRQLVYHQLAEWQGAPLNPAAKKDKINDTLAEKHEEGVHSTQEETHDVERTYDVGHFVRFDRRIRKVIKAAMMKSARLTYRQALFPSMPTMLMFADRLPYALFQSTPPYALAYVLDVLVTVFLFFPLAIRLFDILYERLSRIPRLVCLIDVVAALGCTVVLFGFWMVQIQVLYMGSWGLVGGFVIVQAAALCIVYKNPLRLSLSKFGRVVSSQASDCLSESCVSSVATLSGSGTEEAKSDKARSEETKAEDASSEEQETEGLPPESVISRTVSEVSI
eukprot:TRINITY_DN36996_c3_g1_i1.p1 TRINITY_DN36996_c3_g1~~TRINITY_DN36996_c3_g1_i1.p1  ORF type:complete len:623 (+),score=38.99 TRINITY_DN36996_c3_g1_i1:102-1970(+)